MARPLRIEFEGAWYHVMNRGAGRQLIFKHDRQREYFLSLLELVTERFNAEIHAFCLMDNHYHLMLRTPQGNLQRIMRHINGVYTQYYNRSEKKDGSLFRGRYKAILVDAENYWLELSRYIHRNPLDAGIVKRLENYQWSSYLDYLSVHNQYNWLTTEYILSQYSKQKSRAKERYEAFVLRKEHDDVTKFYQQIKISPILGNDDFIGQKTQKKRSNINTPELKRIKRQPSIYTVIQKTALHCKVPTKELMLSRRGRSVTNPARSMAMLVLHDVADYTLEEISRYFGLASYASAGSTVRAMRKRVSEERAMKKLFNYIKLDLTP